METPFDTKSQEYRVVPPEEVAAILQKQEAHIAAARAKAYEAGDWSSYLFLCTRRGLRLLKFCGIQHRLSDAEYWEMLAELWVDTELPSTNRPLWRELFTSTRGGREHLMSAAEHAVLNGLPPHVTLFRGAALKFARGMAWTLDRDKAAWFARRFEHGAIITATVPKCRVLACFLAREEDEVVIDSRRIRYEVLESERAVA